MINPKGAPPGTYEAPVAEGAIFSDDFQNGLSAWTHSEVSTYNGRFQVGQGADPAIAGDQGMIIPEKARHYAITAPLDGLTDMNGKDFALSYEVKLDDGMTCGGAYVKLPTIGFPGSEKFDNSIKYSIMFGPDKCGSTEKVHFIFQSMNPVSKKYVEHHLKNPPALATSYDKNHHLYALYVKSDGSFSVEVDGEVKREGSLMEEFDPPLQPSKEIDDPEDTKPDDWVDDEKIEDPKATKPDDWDEDAPQEIPDPEATKPDDWLDDEPLKIEDPKAARPEGWIEEEDGAWTSPMIDNPKCAEASGCGKWKAPMKENPDYKGKWTAPMIANPKYVGAWKPKKIANPDYYEVTSPTLLPMHAIGFEIWTMDQGVLFDDIYVGTDISAAKKFAGASFEPKKLAAAEKEKEEQKKADEEAKRNQEKETKGPLGAAKKMLSKMEDAVDFLEQKLGFLEDKIVEAGGETIINKMIDLGISKPMTVVVGVPLLLVTLFLVILAGGKKQPRAVREAAAQAKKTDAVTKDDEPKKVSETTEGDEKEVESEITASESTTVTEEGAEKTVRKRRAAKVE